MAFSKDNSIIIFDLDDTLVVSNAKIVVKDQLTGESFQLSPQEFNSYIKEPHHAVDYSQFSDPAILKAGRLVEWVVNILKRAYDSGTAVGIITARDSKALVRDFLLHHGIDIHPRLVFAVNERGSEFTGDIAERKKQAFEKLIEMGFNNFTFYDDDKKNLEIAKGLEAEYPITIKTRKIGKTQVPKLKVKKVGIISGKFKPPHKGHYKAIREIAGQNDITYVFISKKPEGGISGDQAKAVLDYYFDDTDTVEFRVAEITPVRSGYELIEELGLSEEAPNIEVNLYGLPEDLARWGAYQKWQGKLAKINLNKTDRPALTDSGEGVSGTSMRLALETGDMERFKQGIPQGFSLEKVMSILGRDLEEDLLLPAIYRPKRVINKDIDKDPPDYQPQPVGIPGAVPAHWGAYRGTRQELDAPRVSLGATNRVKNFSEFLFDK